VGTLKKYDLAGKETGTVDIQDDLLKASAHSQMIKDYIVAMHANARQWSANTKGRSEVNRTGKKPYRQKGTGQARQGCFAAPQYRGGGVVFGPKPKFDQHVRINKKEKRAAIAYLLSERIKSESVSVLDATALTEPKTKTVSEFLAKLNVQGKRVLVLGSSENNPIVLRKSLRNIPKTQFTFATNVNGYELMLSSHVVILDSAVEDTINLLGKGSANNE